MDINGLNLARPGSPILARDWNAIVEFLRSINLTADHRKDLVSFETDFDLPAHSLFTLSGTSAFATTAKFHAAKFGAGDSGSDTLWFTNGGVAVDNGYGGIAFPIGFNEPVALTYSGAVPKIGHPCGPKLGDVSVIQNGAGLVCISKPMTYTNEADEEVTETFAKFMRLDGSPLIGKLNAAIAAISSGTLSTGTARIQFRSSSDVLQAAYDPNDIANQTFDVDVWNVLERDLLSGETVYILPCAGVGLVAVPLEQRYWAKTTSTFSAATATTLTSGTVELYTRSGTTLSLSGVSISAVHGGSEAVASGIKVQIAPVAGAWTLVWEDCA